MSITLSSLDEALTENAHLMETLLQQQQYDNALLCMDDRLVLVARLVQLAKDEPAQQQDIATLATVLTIQEASMSVLATSHHQTIFKQLTLVGRANKAGRAYRVNSKEF
ncbi:hypothetical protein [Aeromonas sp. BIGb0445]|uniref:hypothetical protein n=1 Tax=Aeromonas sp. BIGb0445 TaxID=2940593 RepID=UPI00216A7241|nr:hypothetical protein [Aeromonas sp. BIGb0445]MCS3458603.1 hypothetical protein [Aeromonas sp. BIGb0445]